MAGVPLELGWDITMQYGSLSLNFLFVYKKYFLFSPELLHNFLAPVQADIKSLSKLGAQVELKEQRK